MLKKENDVLFLLHLLSTIATTSTNIMSLLVEFQVEVLDYAKSMPEAGKAEDLDFEVWGKGFCGMMVHRPFCVLKFV